MFHDKMTKAAIAAAAGIAALAPLTAAADEVADFYNGKNVTIVVAAGPGGGHSVYSQLMSPGLQKHLPGNPKFINQNMGGAGGTKAANYLYNTAPQDGTYIGILLQDTPLASRLRATGIKYDPSKFHYLGGADTTRSAFIVMKAAGVSTLDDVKKTQVTMGSSGKGSQTFVVPTLVNAILGTKFKVVLGYRGMNGIYLAMDRGEVQGFQSVWSAISYLRPNWISDNKVAVLATASLDPLPDLPKVPLVIDMVKDPLDHAVMKLVSGMGVLGRGWLAAPGMPKARLDAMRAAFEKTFADPAIVGNAKKRKLPWEPTSWQKMQAQVALIMNTEKKVIDRIRSIIGVK
jgi:tripartite-type tricarboxylate transporter receptor subunit TctC